MAVSPAVRVGIIIFIALLAFGFAAWFLTGYRLRAAGYEITAVFDSALGLSQGSEVRMAGVTIGMVDSVELDEDQRAVVRMRINRRHSIPEGSQFILRVGLLIGERFVDIIPDREAEAFLPENAVVEGEVPPRIEDLLPQAQQVLVALTQAAENLQEIFDDEGIRERVERSFANIERATERLDETMAVIQGTVTQESEQVAVVMENVRIATESVREMTATLERFIADGRIQEDVRQTVASARRATDSLERTVAGLEQVVGDPQFQEDVRVTASEARQATEGARQVFQRIGRILGTRPGMPEIQTRSSNLEAVYFPDDNRFRATIQTSIPLKEDRYLRLGMYDIGAGNKFIFQPGQAIGPRTDFRYGLYASRLGVGFDHAFDDRWFGTLNVWDSRDVRLDVQAGYRVDDRLGLLLGVDRLFSDNQISLGVRLSR